MLLAHGKGRSLANGVMIWGSAASALVALVIMLGMCGLRLRFE